VKFVHVVGFIKKKFVMMNGHMNVKKAEFIIDVNERDWFRRGEVS
jgi:hypothetical protein